MHRYIALLRGINVGGHKKLPMAELRSLFESMGFSDVQTYIQSGNVVFSSESATEGTNISEAIREKYGWEVPVLVITAATIRKVLDMCPFPQEKKEKSYFGLLYKPPTAEAVEITRSFYFPGEEFSITPQCVYLYSGVGFGKSKIGGNFFEKKLGVAITTRNYRTLMKLLELAHSN